MRAAGGRSERRGAGAFSHRSVPSPVSQPPKDDKKKKDAGKSAKKDKDPVNKSGGKAKKKVGARGGERGRRPYPHTARAGLWLSALGAVGLWEPLYERRIAERSVQSE